MSDRQLEELAVLRGIKPNRRLDEWSVSSYFDRENLIEALVSHD